MPLTWIFFGQASFGFIIGVVAGMSEKPIATVILPLLFSYAGGSVVALGFGTTITGDGGDFVGQQMLGFSGGTALGIASGMFLKRKFQLKLFSNT